MPACTVIDGPCSSFRTPLHLASSAFNLDMTKLLICSGASVFATTVDGDSPIDVAIDELSEEDFEEGLENDCIEAIRGTICSSRFSFPATCC